MILVREKEKQYSLVNAHKLWVNYKNNKTEPTQNEKGRNKDGLSPILLLITRQNFTTTVSTAVEADVMCPPHLTTLWAGDQVKGCEGVM